MNRLPPRCHAPGGSDHAGAGGPGTSTSVGPDPATTTLPDSESPREWLDERTQKPAGDKGQPQGVPLASQDPDRFTPPLGQTGRRQAEKGEAVESKRGAY
ncbi:MAG TPA: hypothetical protein VLA61_09910 [Ideonella sp.]|uniref:hypothetical protein n=1 Tax=Ideonella sp. TaxID=1929293 RepID=UPI002C10DDFB|nr:hypothetical protein [Ideonella sp.]HSI48574.1 hypothetical protein [Ideonella sp.]